MANKQNLLLLLSRGRWSTDFLKATTEAYWDWEHNLTSSGDPSPWPVDTLANAKYAPAPNGTYLTDGMVALMAALTANPEAAGWAFADFQPTTTTLNYGDPTTPWAASPTTSSSSVLPPDVSQASGMTASVTALMSAIQATGGSYSDQAAGPMADLFVLQDYQGRLPGFRTLVPEVAPSSPHPSRRHQPDPRGRDRFRQHQRGLVRLRA